MMNGQCARQTGNVKIKLTLAHRKKTAVYMRRTSWVLLFE